MGKAADEALNELASRMAAYRERATAARRLAASISDQRATAVLIEHADEFDRQAEAIAVQIVLLAHAQDGAADRDHDDDALSAAALEASTRNRD